MSSNIKIARICQHCGHEFIAKTTVTKYCGDDCAKRAYKARIKKQKINKSEVETQKQRNTPNVTVKTLEYLTVKEAAAMLKCDPRTIYDMIEYGRLHAVNLSIRKTRIHKKDIDALFSYQPILPNTQDKSVHRTKLPAEKDCYSIGDILLKYGIADATLRRILLINGIPKYNVGKFVYVAKRDIEPILNSFIVEDL